MADPNLIEFYGTECAHCRTMEPLIQRLKEEEGIELTRLEVWHNEKNAELLQEMDEGFCGGVPFFFNRKTGKWLCGSAPYEQLREWALGR